MSKFHSHCRVIVCKAGAMDRFVFTFVCLLLCLSVACAADKKLIVVLVDGLRWDYINDPNLKGIPRIIENGVSAPYVVPVYPSLSYPNYQSIATGLYPENHGFVDNYMFLNDSGKFFGMIPAPGSTDRVWWNLAEPVWITAEKNGRPSALYWWAGCEVEISQAHPTICERQRFGPVTPEETLDFLERIDDVVQMFKPSHRFPKDRLSLAMMYYGAVDYEGHLSGPKSPKLKEALYDIDDILHKMQSKIQKAGLQDEVNIMVVGDHGMTEINGNTKYISLEKFSSKIKYQLETGPLTMIMPMPGMVDQLYAEIKSDKMEGFQVFKKENIPEEYHIRDSDRIFPLYLTAKKGYSFKALEDPDKLLGSRPYKKLGDHGYDPEEVKDMRTVFFATGPDFRKGFKTGVLNNVDLYNVMCTLLRMEPLPNNGSFERVESMLLRTETPQPISSSAAVISTDICIFLLICAINFALVFVSLEHYLEQIVNLD